MHSDRDVKLLNCPCCNGEAKLHDYDGRDFLDNECKTYFIKCEKCGLITRHSTSLDTIIRNWNRRRDNKEYNIVQFFCGFILGVIALLLLFVL